MGDNMSVSKLEIDNRDVKQLQRAFDEADYILMKKYQYELSS